MRYQNNASKLSELSYRINRQDKTKNILAAVFCYKKESLVRLVDILEYNYEIINQEVNEIKKEVNGQYFQEKCTSDLYIKSLKQRSAKLLNSINLVRRKITVIKAIEKQT